MEATHISDDQKASCSQSEVNSILNNRLQRCDYYGVSHSTCVEWIEEEVERSCGGKYSCIETTMTEAWASYKTYSGMSSK